jgi:hypothetical protein
MCGEIMKYIYNDLGEQQHDCCVIAHLRGSAANVILLDEANFDRYRFGKPFEYSGGLCTRTPAQLQIPEDGHWYLVIDCGGYRHHVHVDDIQVSAPDESPVATDAKTTLVGASA